MERNAAPRAAAGGAARGDGYPLLAGDAHDPRHLFRGQRQNDEIGFVSRDERNEGGVIRIAEPAEFGIEDMVLPDDVAESFFDARIDHFPCLPPLSGAVKSLLRLASVAGEYATEEKESKENYNLS